MSDSKHAGEVRRCTASAVLFNFQDDDVDRWVPRSVCVDGGDLEPGDRDIRIKDWWAEKEGLL